MDSERWNKINEVFSASLDLPGEEQARFLAEACRNDETLRTEVQALIDAHLQADHFIETPVFHDAALAMANEEDLLKIDQQIGSYKILKEIGRGGMGAVYLAARADQEYKKQVAIKLIKRGMDTEQVLHRFRNERQILANFDHPNIARLLEGGSTSNGQPYFVMEYVEGLPIDGYCDDNNLSVTHRLELFRQVCAAVSYAHRNLVVHRDIKPSNILITTEGLPKLLDFGIAKILQPHSDEHTTATGFMPMTPEYASPEQALGANVTTYSDIYSLGVLLYELLTGHLPYQLKNVPAMEVARIITETRPQAPSTIVNTVAADLTPETVSKCREGTPERLRRRLRGDLDNIVLMAMRKEAHRRYQSVEQLSEDIRRHLEGHPVIARKDTFLYRGTKFIKRNKIAAAFAVLALVAITIAGMIRWRTNQQAASFQEFGQEVARIEAAMRYAYLLPLHNVEPDKKQVMDRLESIKKRMQEMGSLSYGPGHYSLGRGYLSLHRYQDAYDNLILAWQKYRYQEPAVANALGLSLAMLYQEKLREAEQLYNKQQFNQRKLELEKHYRLPAKQYIQKGANASEAPEYVQALLAFLEKQYPEALNKARAAEQQISWHYESKKLQGDILAAMANDQSNVGKTNAAAELYEKAKEAYLEAAMKGQSDPQIYEGLCALQSALQKMHLDQQGTPPPEVVEEGIRYCEKAIIADSGTINANLYAAEIYTDLAYDQYLHGIDCTKATEKAVRFAGTVLKTDSQNGSAHRALGNAYKTLAAAEIQKGGNPIRSLENAGFNLEKGSEKMPENADLLSNLGALYIHRGQYEHSAGKNGAMWIEKALQKLQKAVDLNPNDSKYHCNLGIAYFWRGYIEEESGMDPRDSLKRSIEESEKSILLNPAYRKPYGWTAAAANNLAFNQMTSGVNPIPVIDYSIKMQRKALTLEPGNAYSYGSLGYSFLFKGQYLRSINTDPTKELQSARENFEKSIHMNNKLLSNYEALGEVELQFARYAMIRSKSPRSYFEKADEILEQGLKIGTESYRCHKVFAALHLLKAQHLSRLGQSPWTEIRLGIEAADRTIHYNPKMAQVYGTRGGLYLLEARLQHGLLRLKAAQEAVASFDKALKLDRNLRKEFGNEWEEAKQLAQN